MLGPNTGVLHSLPEYQTVALEWTQPKVHYFALFLKELSSIEGVRLNNMKFTTTFVESTALLKPR